MLSHVLRFSARHPPASLCRHVTTAPPKQTTPKQVKLAPGKMRALISLYHQSETFVTPENLSATIDGTFLDDQDIWDTLPGGGQESSEKDLQTTLQDRRSQPKLRTTHSARSLTTSRSADTWLPSASVENISSWSTSKEGRELQLKAALYGIEPSGEVPKPGLEVLEEEHERVQKSLKGRRSFRR